MTVHNTRSRVQGARLAHFDFVTNETATDNAPLRFADDFLGAGSAAIPAAGSAENGVFWTSKIVGAAPPTVGAVTNGAGGQMQLALTSASQKQDAALYPGDVLNFDVTKGLVWEARVKLSVTPTTSVQAIMGLQSAWIDGPDNASYYLEFAASASGALLVRKKDGVATTSAAAGVTLATSDWAILRIDTTDVTAVRFYINGVETTNSGVSFGATGANAVLQPYFAMYKASGTGVGTMIVDYVKIWTNR